MATTRSDYVGIVIEPDQLTEDQLILPYGQPQSHTRAVLTVPIIRGGRKEKIDRDKMDNSTGVVILSN